MEIFVKKGEIKYIQKEEGKLFNMVVKSDKMEAVISEVSPGITSKIYQHQGEELHLVISGEIEYIVGDKIYKMNKGDILWHKSNIPHKVRNIGKTKATYITIGTPPTFM